jgi:hypothetical protein
MLAVYDELRALASAHCIVSARHTLQTTALGRGGSHPRTTWRAPAATVSRSPQAIRRILIDHARRAAAKRTRGARSGSRRAPVGGDDDGVDLVAPMCATKLSG